MAKSGSHFERTSQNCEHSQTDMSISVRHGYSYLQQSVELATQDHDCLYDTYGKLWSLFDTDIAWIGSQPLAAGLRPA